MYNIYLVYHLHACSVYSMFEYCICFFIKGTLVSVITVENFWLDAFILVPILRILETLIFSKCSRD